MSFNRIVYKEMVIVSFQYQDTMIVSLVYQETDTIYPAMNLIWESNSTKVIPLLVDLALVLTGDFASSVTLVDMSLVVYPPGNNMNEFSVCFLPAVYVLTPLAPARKRDFTCNRSLIVSDVAQVMFSVK